MPNYLSPGVYVEEVEAGSRPIEGVGTAVAAFVGLAGRGPATRRRSSPTGPSSPRRSVTSSRARTWPTPSTATSSTAAAPRTSCAWAPTARPTATAELPSWTDKAKPAYRVAALEAGPNGNEISVEVQPPRAGRGLVQARRQARRQGRVETYDNVTTAKGKQNVVTVGQGAVEADHDRGGRQRARSSAPGARHGDPRRRRGRRAVARDARRLHRQLGRPDRLRRPRGRRRGHDAGRARPDGGLREGR